MHHRLLKHRASSNAETDENYVFSNLDYRRLQICRSAAPQLGSGFKITVVLSASFCNDFKMLHMRKKAKPL